MFPVLFSIGNISVSSFGVFLSIGFLLGIFLIWRISRAWDLNEEKILDLTLLTFFGGLLGARIYFALEHFDIFQQNWAALFLFNMYPGFSFWGAILGGWLTLYFYTGRKKWDFWQVADIVTIGFLGGLILADLGCFLGGCSVGIKSNLFLAVNMVGVLGKRFPTQALEAMLLLLAFLNLWSQATRFHPRGKIVSLGLIYIGLIKLMTEPLKEVSGEGSLLSAILVVLGITILYKVTRRNLRGDFRNLSFFIYKLITDPAAQKNTLANFQKNWYSTKTLVFWKLRNWKKFLRRINVRVS